ncbi:MAG TPA: 16S rRNA (guanine(527)-N(7))-methyltransferase RsmG [Pyrinomonadaceae bacterium]|nr:16S rRNA (guanine(527)-N(7))-methyltransferase RsmG [Pyrinomonadaceae bacterium]
MRNEFIQALKTHQTAFKISLDDTQIDRLADYFELIQEHNPILHLVAPMTPEEFAIRHILESLTMMEYLPNGSRFADIGTGGGLPSIPCLLVRGDLKGVLIESKEKKTKFLELATATLGISKRTAITNKQFQEVDPANSETVTCRALDKFTEKLPGLLKWRKRRQMLLFGGPNLRDALEKNKVVFVEKLMPMSEQRYLFVLNR